MEAWKWLVATVIVAMWISLDSITEILLTAI